MVVVGSSVDLVVVVSEVLAAVVVVVAFGVRLNPQVVCGFGALLRKPGGAPFSTTFHHGSGVDSWTFE